LPRPPSADRERVEDHLAFLRRDGAVLNRLERHRADLVGRDLLLLEILHAAEAERAGDQIRQSVHHPDQRRDRSANAKDGDGRDGGGGDDVAEGSSPWGEAR
jgi:hypothetical protein